MNPTVKSVLARPLPALAMAVALIVVIVAATHAVRTVGQSHQIAIGIVSALPRVFELALFAAGLCLLAFALPRREGTTWHCASCGYQRIEEIHKLLPNCPECGHRWRLFGGWRVGRPIGSRWALTRALLVILAGASAMLFRDYASPWFVSKFSTPMLIRHAVNAPADLAIGSWAELEKRPLTMGQRDWIAESLLDRRWRSGFLDRRSEAWLNDSITNNLLSPSVSSRYYEELADFWLEVPETAMVGDTIAAEVHGRYRGPATDTPLGQAVLAVESISITTPGLQPTDRIPMAELTDTSQSARTIDPLSLHVRPTLGRNTAQATEPGVATVKAVVWVMLNVTDGESIRWRPDGPLTVSWARKLIRRELTAQITIKPVPQN